MLLPAGYDARGMFIAAFVCCDGTLKAWNRIVVEVGLVFLTSLLGTC